jgi:Sec-independent protein translocase protein TatA
MFKLGFGEILLVVFVVFLISPMEIPKILRTIGRLWGRLRKFAAQFREYADDMDLPDLSLRGGKKDEPDRSEGKSPRPRADAREGGPVPDPSISGGESRPPNGQPQSDQGSAAVPRSVTEQRSPDSRSERQILSTGSVGMAGPAVFGKRTGNSSSTCWIRPSISPRRIWFCLFYSISRSG